MGSQPITLDKVLDINRAREGAKAYEAKLTNDGVVLPTDAKGIKLPNGDPFDSTWADLASGNMDVYFGGSKHTDAVADGVTYSIKNETDRSIVSADGYTTANITSSSSSARH